MTPRFFRQFRFLLLCLSAAVWIWTASAAMKPVIVPMNIPPAPDGERFLFILDVSSGMENLQAGNETALYELISTGVRGYMRAGDENDPAAGQAVMNVLKALAQALSCFVLGVDHFGGWPDHARRRV